MWGHFLPNINQVTKWIRISWLEHEIFKGEEKTLAGWMEKLEERRTLEWLGRKCGKYWNEHLKQDEKTGTLFVWLKRGERGWQMSLHFQSSSENFLRSSILKKDPVPCSLLGSYLLERYKTAKLTKCTVRWGVSSTKFG